MTENWKPIKGYEKYYAVSDKGNVRSYWGFYAQGRPRGIKILKRNLNRDGYPFVVLYNGDSHRTRCIHKLVAAAFIETDDLKTDIDHINGDKTDNSLVNLRRISHRENLKSKTRTVSSTKRKSIIATLPNGESRFFNSLREASRQLGITSGQVCKCAKGYRDSVRGYKFQYAE